MKFFENKRRFFDKIVIRERKRTRLAKKSKNKGKVPQKAMSNKMPILVNLQLGAVIAV